MRLPARQLEADKDLPGAMMRDILPIKTCQGPGGHPETIKTRPVGRAEWPLKGTR